MRSWTSFEVAGIQSLWHSEAGAASQPLVLEHPGTGRWVKQASHLAASSQL